jgi:site-specific DNA-methyltransferase (adenine-specific)
MRRESEAVYKEIVTSGPRKLADLMQALLAFLGRNDMMAYLVMMAIRLVEHTPAPPCQACTGRQWE